MILVLLVLFVLFQLFQKLVLFVLSVLFLMFLLLPRVRSNLLVQGMVNNEDLTSRIESNRIYLRS